MSDHTKTFELDAAEHASEVVGEHHDEHGHDEHGHDDHGHDNHGHDAHGHDDHADHGHHAPPAPKYRVAPPARVGDVSVRTWVAYGIFLLLIVILAGAMLAGFGK